MRFVRSYKLDARPSIQTEDVAVHNILGVVSNRRHVKQVTRLTFEPARTLSERNLMKKSELKVEIKLNVAHVIYALAFLLAILLR